MPKMSKVFFSLASAQAIVWVKHSDGELQIGNNIPLHFINFFLIIEKVINLHMSASEETKLITSNLDNMTNFESMRLFFLCNLQTCQKLICCGLKYYCILKLVFEQCGSILKLDKQCNSSS